MTQMQTEEGRGALALLNVNIDLGMGSFNVGMRSHTLGRDKCVTFGTLLI